MSFHFAKYRSRRLLHISPVLCILLLLPLACLQDSQPGRFEAAFLFANNLYHRGHLQEAETAAASGYATTLTANQQEAQRFQLLLAEIRLWRGYYRDAQELSTSTLRSALTPAMQVRAHSIAAQALIFQYELPAAAAQLQAGEQLCMQPQWAECALLLKTQSAFFMYENNPAQAYDEALAALKIAQHWGDTYLALRTTINMSWITYDNREILETLNWIQQAVAEANSYGDEDSQLIARNSQIKYSYNYGDTSENHAALLDAERRAQALGNTRTELQLLNTLVASDLAVWHLQDVEHDARQLLILAQKLNDRNQLIFGRKDLIDALLWDGKLSEAEKTLNDFRAFVPASDHRNNTWALIRQARLTTLQGHPQEAIALLQPVQATETDPFTQIAVSNQQGNALALAGKTQDAENTYRKVIGIMETAMQHGASFTTQAHLKSATSILFTDFIGLLARQGRGEEALRQANRFFADAPNAITHNDLPDPRLAARKSGATILTYWLGHDASWLWVVTPQAVHTVQLPSEHILKPQLTAYRQAITSAQENYAAVRAQGESLWQTLVAPAAPYLPANGQVIVIDDEELSQLNFETLLAPGASMADATKTTGKNASHYWIEDVTLRIAPSLCALLAPHAAAENNHRLLLMGDALQASPLYPALPLAAQEARQVSQHFSAQQSTVLTREKATPQNYAASSPGQYAYLHFVAHSAPGSADPMDAMIVLSPDRNRQETWQLTARTILAHPLHARLVTISACSGSGSRFFAGQGMVGLSSAFQSAGAVNVIGALWDVSDQSSPLLMDRMYAALQSGSSPASALRQAKLHLLHGTPAFRRPFFWAPFQTYSVD